MEIETLKMNVQRKSLEQNTARISIAQARERLEEEGLSYDSMKQEQIDIEAQLKELTESKGSIQAELASSEAAEKTAQEKIIVYQKELEGLRTEESVASTQVNEWDLKVERMLQTQKFHQSNVDRIQGETQRFQDRKGGELSRRRYAPPNDFAFSESARQKKYCRVR